MSIYYMSVNTESDQGDPFVLSIPGGPLIGLWSDLEPDPGINGHYGVYARAWSPDLTAASAEDEVIPDLTDDIQSSPMATAFRDGGFVTMFESRGESARDGSEDPYYDTYLKFFDPSGNSRGEAIQITRNVSEDQFAGGIATLTNGQSVALVARQVTAGEYDLVAYRHDSDGDAVGAGRRVVEGVDVYVNSFTGTEYLYPDIAAGKRGTYAVVWQERTAPGEDPAGYAVKARAFAADGTPLAGETTIAPVLRDGDEILGMEQLDPHITGRTAGGYAAAWTREAPEDDEAGVGSDAYFRLLESDAHGETKAVRVNGDRVKGDQAVQDVLDLGQGKTLVTYTHTVEDAFDDLFDGQHLYGRVMGDDGRWLGKSVRLTDYLVEDLSGGNTVISSTGLVVATFAAAAGTFDDVFILSHELVLPWEKGGRGDDVMRGTLVADRLSGQRGDDWLRGGTGDDTLNGGAGADRLAGQEGDDRLRGGAGADQFIIGGGGRDVIEDFRGNDRITIAGASRAELRDLLDDARSSGGDTILDLGGDDSLRVKNTDPADLSLGDFLI